MTPHPQTVSTILRVAAWATLGGGVSVTLFAAINGGWDAVVAAFDVALFPAFVGWAVLLGFYAVLVLLLDMNDVLWHIAEQNEDDYEPEPEESPPPIPERRKRVGP